MKGQKASPRFLGGAAVAAAYAAWGTLTIFWNLLADVNPVYILAQRLIWSMVFMGIYMAVTGKLKDIAPAFNDKRTFLLCLACGALVTVNWGVYIYAVNSSHVLDASLGYFIEPVIVALIGMTAFKEKPSKYEKITFILAAAGLIYMVAASRTFPTLALLIAGSFAVYGAVKKKLTLTPHASLFAETLLMTPFAIAFVIYATVRMPGCTGSLSGAQFLLLPACGIVTSTPLLLFNIGVQKIPYYFSGILMYINPTLQFLMGLFYFREELDRNRLIAFMLIWIGVLFTVYDKVRMIKSDRRRGNNVCA